MDQDTEFEAKTYVSRKPNVRELISAYDETVTELGSYFHYCRESEYEHDNYWEGKSRDLRKYGSDAVPWEGASDLESMVVKERMQRLVSLMMSAAKRANVQANPVGMEDGPRAALVRKFMKWMLTSGYIKRINKELELGAYYLLERGLLITHIGWHREDRTVKQAVTIQQIAEANPQIAEMILTGGRDDELVAIIQQMFPSVKDAGARKGIEEIRETGTGEFPMVQRSVNCPSVQTLAPDGEFLFPPFTSDPQRAPYCFWRTYYTVQELKNKVSTDGWDESFVDYVIEHHRGESQKADIDIDEGRRNVRQTGFEYEADEIVEIVHAYQRLIDPSDNSEGIYETIFHESFGGEDIVKNPEAKSSKWDSDDLDDFEEGEEPKVEYIQPYAKHELMNGYTDYPVEVTKAYENNKRLYDVDTIPMLLRGMQWQVKIETDSRIDRNSISTMPPMMHRMGYAPDDYGPGARIPYMSKGDIDFAPIPAYDPGSVEMERNMQARADRLVGLDVEDPLSQVQRQAMTDKFLDHIGRVLYRCFQMFQRFGPDDVMFRVTGSPEMVEFKKGDPNENYDVLLSYDVMNTDPETLEKKLSQIASLIQMDRNGTMDVDKFIALAASSIDPIVADQMLIPSQDAQKKIGEQVTADLGQIYAGIERPALPNGAQIALQVIQAYTQQPDIQQRLMQDEAFRARLEKYQGQYTFMMQQAQNAQIGKIGTAPAQMGGVQTQGMQQQG